MLWKVPVIALLTALCTWALIDSVNSYTKIPVFLLLTALTLAATLVGGSVLGIASLATSVGV